MSTDRERYLINTARAGVVDEAVLDRIGPGCVFDAAGLDVYPDHFAAEVDAEPAADTADCGRIYFTPHVAGLTREATARMRTRTAENVVEAFTDG